MTFWLVPRSQIPAPAPGPRGDRGIQGGPLIDLPALQLLLRSGNFDTDQLWIATPKCAKDLRKEKWSSADVLQMLTCLDAAQDYYKSEWCEVASGPLMPCDAYRLPYDSQRKCRAARSGFRVYLKFSLDDDGAITITLVSCHEG